MNREVKRIIDTYNLILENKRLIFEAQSNSSTLFGGLNFKWGGGPSDHASRALGNWQSDNSWDIMAPVGTPVYAIESGKITKLGGSLELKGTVYGYSVTIQSVDNEFFYTHLGQVAPNLTLGTQVQKGDLLGYIGAPNSTWPQHVHIGIKRGDISKYMDKSGNIVGHQQPSSTGTQTNSKFQFKDDEVLARAARRVGTAMGLSEDFKNTKTSFGTLLIPGSSNKKIKSPVEGIVNNTKYFSDCKNKLIISFSNKKQIYYLVFCGLNQVTVRDGQKISKGDLIGKMDSDDNIEVSLYDSSFIKKSISGSNFDVKKDDEGKNKNEKTSTEKTYYDPALAAIMLAPFKLFKKKEKSESKLSESINRIKKML